MSNNLPVPYYYNQMSAKERSYVDYMGEINKDIGSKIEDTTKEISSSIVSAQIATSKAIYNNTQELKGTLMAGFLGVSSQIQSGFSDVSRELGFMNSNMSMEFARLNIAVQQSSVAICKKLDEINNTLKNPLYTESRELYNRAAQNYNKGLYEEVLEDLQEAIKKNKTDPFSHFLLGQTYLYGISEFSNVINLDASIESLRNAAKYITHDAKTHHEARLMAAEILFYLGLAYHTKANDMFHDLNKSDYEKNIEEAKTAYNKSWNYSNKMLESLYNLARCKALSSEVDGAIHDLITVILMDHGYCIKAFIESDFDSKFKDNLYSQLRKKVFPETKAIFDRIENIKANFQNHCSPELIKLCEAYLPNTFTENTPPFDMLEATIYFPKILSILENEYNDFEEERKEKERIAEEKRKEMERLEEAKLILFPIRERLSRFQKCISVGKSHIVGLRMDGTVITDGNGSIYNSESNTQKWRNIVAVSAGMYHTIGLQADGTVIAVGSNKDGQCNTQGWRDIVAIAAGECYTIGLRADGTVIAVGANYKGQCNTQGWRDIVAIAAGDYHTIGLRTDGTVIAVGANDEGQCNTQGLQDIVAIAANRNYSAGLKANGTVLMAGRYANETQDWLDIVAIAAGFISIIGIKIDGTVISAGYWEYLPDYNCSDRYGNSQEWRNMVAVYTNFFGTFGLKMDGTLVMVGKNDSRYIYDRIRDWRDIGPIPEDKLVEMKQALGICPYCGGRLSGLFSKKCKSCGKASIT